MQNITTFSSCYVNRICYIETYVVLNTGFSFFFFFVVSKLCISFDSILAISIDLLFDVLRELEIEIRGE